ncbi:MAG: PVC-type heme-binding CxxCH protein, partial [Planctomycetaceae bacterium]
MRARFYLLLSLCLIFCTTAATADVPLKILFLGDNGHHRPEERFLQLEPVLRPRGIELTYIADPAQALTPETLARYDGLLLYANIDAIEPDNADALLEYVASGHGFIPLHCATYCFRNDPRIVSLMGGQFKRHGGEVFSTVIADPSHPVMQGYSGFTSWDETYIHTLHNNQNRTVLEYRLQGDQEQGQDREPWTWTRTHSLGRVFYTAWGHDERTWGHPGFQNLVERGVRWACGDDPTKAGPYHEAGRFDPLPMTVRRTDVEPFEYVDVGAKIPHYVESDKWGVQAAPETTMQLPLSPEESLKHYVVPLGFELRLYASESQHQPASSDIDATVRRAIESGLPTNDSPHAGLGGKPIAMNWDERGRLWVCETLDYPNELQPHNKGHDRIRICEDTDGDGQADKFTLFAEGLSIPTSVLPIYGGALVQNGTETLFLKDIDGDDRADLREILLTGWALGDTHGGVSNFRYGLDNWIYAMQGYNDSQPVIAATGEKGPRFRQGFWRMKLGAPNESKVQSRESRGLNPRLSTQNTEHVPQVLAIEFLRSTNNNTWGLGLSEEGLIFGSTANRNPSEFMPIPNRYYERVLGWGPSRLEGIADSYKFQPITTKVRQVDQFGGYTAGAGHALYTARNYPQQFWNRTAFTCGPTGHLVGTFVFSPDGAGFKSTSPCNLVASDDEWAAPIMAEVGPDGNVWVLDWYNYIVQHNPTPQGFKTGKGNAYESDLRDRKHGRIYRLLYSQSQTPADKNDVTLDSHSSPEKLVDSLRSPTMSVRLQAQRILLERHAVGMADQLVKLAHDQTVDAIGLNVGAIHALRTLDGLGLVQESNAPVWKAVVAALQHPSAGVRRTALQVLPRVPAGLTALLSGTSLNDTDLQVRLAAILALSDMPPNEDVGQPIVGLIAGPDNVMRDRWLADAVNSAAAAHAFDFLQSFVDSQSSRSGPAPSAEGVEWTVIRRVAEHIARSQPSTNQIDRLVSVVHQADSQFVSVLLDGLIAGWQKNHHIGLSAESERSLVELLDRAEGAEKAKVIRLASLMGSQVMDPHSDAIVASMLGVIQNPEEPIPMRRDAAEQLVSFRPDDPSVVDGIVSQITPQSSPALTKGLVDALAGSKAENVGPELVQLASVATPALREQLLHVLLSRPRTSLSLLKGVSEGQLALSDLKLDQKTALVNHPNREVRELAKKVL